MTHVLVVDDERAIRQALSINLRARDYEVTAVGDGASALAAAASHPPDVVILDLGLPDMDGNDVIEGLRGWSSAPIIVLSARTGQGDKVVSLDGGADDYITKPFGMDELLARLRAALRRSGTDPEAPVVETESFTVDLAAKQASTPAGPVRLTPTEWHLLEVLVRHEGKLVSQRELLQEVWGPQYETETNYLRVYMAQLRRKLEPDPAHPRHLITEPGIGYRFERGPSLVRERRVGPGGQLDELLRRRHLDALGGRLGLEPACVARHPGQVDRDLRRHERLPVLAEAAGADALRGRGGGGARVLDRVAGEEDLHVVTLLGGRARHEQREGAAGRVLGAGRQVDQELRHHSLIPGCTPPRSVCVT